MFSDTPTLSIGWRKLRLQRPVIFLVCALSWATLGTTAWANNAGGFTTLVTTPVTTGTESFGSSTDHFLDNGILHVEVAANGQVDSIKYLKPGSTGTPKANGVEMISQTGVTTGGFGNHKQIYYYWYPDGSGDSVFLSATSTATTIDLAYKRTYNPLVDQVPVDMEIHYVLGVGNTALYVYLVANHPASYATYGTCNIGFIQMIWPAAHDANNFLCEKIYIDNVKTGLSLNGVQETRAALEPSFADVTQSVNVTGLPKEIYEATSGFFNSQLFGKYSYTFNYGMLGVWGRASDVNHVGEWVVNPSHEYMSNGPTMCEYGHGEGLLYNTIVSPHYENTGIAINSTASWTMVYGPWALYFNSQTTGNSSWQDAQAQQAAEQAAWPYAWMPTTNFAPASQRATVTGKLVITDTLRPGTSAAGAWVGLAAPDSGVENAPNNWQYQSDNYQYWVQADSSGNFTIPNVRTTDAYGQVANYRLYAFSAGTSPTTGAVGEFSANVSTLTAGATTNLGTLTWNVPHKGVGIVWEIGIPDRSAAEFKHGDEYAKPNLWANFANEFTNPLEYNVADNNWATALNYEHSVDNVGVAPWKWHINFNLSSVVAGTYWLNIAYAAPSSVQVIRVNDDSSILTTFTPDNGVPGATTYVRQGIHSKYSVAHVAIPSSNLHVGNNTITLDHEVHSTHATAGFMYDYIDFESPPLPPPPPSSGRSINWGSAPPASNWDNGVTNSFLNGASTTSFGAGDQVNFTASGSNTTNITLTGNLAPNLVNVSGTKNYTFTGTGNISGPITLTKSGTGILTIAPTLSAVSNCTTTTNSATITVSDSTGLSPGMLATVNTNNANGVPDGSTIASITDGTHVVLSQLVTRANTGVQFNFSTPYTYSGGTDLQGGTIVLGSVNANDAGLGAGAITFDGGTLSIFDWNGNNLPGSGDVANDFVVATNGTVLAMQRGTISSDVTGGGNLTLSIPFVRTDLTGNWSGFQGHLSVVTTSSSEGDLRLHNPAGMLHAAINLGTKTHAYYTGTMAAGGTSVSLGELSGVAGTALLGGPTANLTLTWSVGGLNTDATFAGNIGEQVTNGITAIAKVGVGNWTLSGTNTYNGTTTVSAGTLLLSGTLNNNSTIEVANSGTLALAGGSCTVASLHVSNGGILGGTGTINGNLTVDGMVMSADGAALVVNGSIVNNGVLLFSGSGTVSASGNVTNNGVLDYMTGVKSLPPRLVNNGVILDSSNVHIEGYSTLGNLFSVSIMTYAGHNYQLQRSDTIISPVWQNIGSATVGDGTIQTLPDDGTAGPLRFYRIFVSP